MYSKTVLIVCMAMFAVTFSLPTSKVEAPKENMETAETMVYSSEYSPIILKSHLVSPIAYRTSVLPYYGGMNWVSHW